mgnify:CR=1 FL=1
MFGNLIDPAQHLELGVVGLGTGTTAAYAQPGQTLTYFEIDPSVVAIARNPKYFTYLQNAERPDPDDPSVPGATIDIVMGDARLSLVDQPDGRFDLLVVDAFSSDAIPIHLITREAFELYFRKLKDDGVLMVHVSNRYLSLAPVVGNIAKDLGLTARVRNDTSDDHDEGRFGSEWIAVVRKPARLVDLLAEFAWDEITADERVGVWTDDFSNIVNVLEWYRGSWLDRLLHRKPKPQSEPQSETESETTAEQG